MNAADLAFAAADLGAAHAAADRQDQPGRSELLDAVGIDVRNLQPAEHGAVVALCTLAYTIGRAGQR